MRGQVAMLALALMCTAGFGVRAQEDLDALLARAREAVAAGDWAKAFEALEPAYLEVFARTPLSVREATFVTAEPKGYGSYTPRPNAVFAPGEPLLVYLEPVGYDFRSMDDGTVVYGFAADVAILAEDGKLLGGQRDFGRWQFRARRPNTAAFISLRLEIGGLPAGRYRLAVRLRDGVSADAAEVELPFEISGG